MKKHNNLLLLVFAAGLLGCIHATAQRIATDDGTERYRIECDTVIDGDDGNDCAYKSDEVCPSGYVFLGSYESTLGYNAQTVVFAPSKSFAVANTKVRRKVHVRAYIECKAPSPEEPKDD